MTITNTFPFVFNYQVDIPSDSLGFIWEKWDELSGWAGWDASLEETRVESDGLQLGKCLEIVPRGGQGPVPVCVTAFIDGVHFTTSSAGPIGMMSIGHTLKQGVGSKIATLEHTICALPANPQMFQEHVWEHLKRGVCQSVDTLAKLAIQRQAR
ncbi:hypothetical protein ACUULL_000018 [Vibrio cholerae]|uniref:hypothetical protein n=1 Tax=Vibrio cholerae TaxID=666 RepID=UPI0028B66CB8|nr:hypothetical protein [Vibrio cholerae]EJB0230108.1 hypothetical protein [Vibrio vulnificus]EKF9485877.1 hypothetical protein [Vibrio cholerae]ELP3384926.1 hypothetical protein [Vibrio cholerae]ELP3388184.1 hypothetical protein [Vibrio cholerae]ELR9907531.1 hypothetical protein [Vibrio cholerae]